MRDDELEGSLLTVIAGAGGQDLLQEAAEFAIDSVLKDGIVKDVPVVGVVAKLYSIATSFQGHMFARKVRRFLVELSSVSHEEREAFARTLEGSPKERTKTATVVLTFLDRLDDLEKAPLLARALRRYLSQEYDFSTFRRLAMAIDRCLVDDLGELEKMREKAISLHSYVGDIFTSAGLASVAGIPTVQADGVKTLYKLSSFGELFLHCVVNGFSRYDPPGV